MRNSNNMCELFRVPTREILEEVQQRMWTQERKQFQSMSSKELLKFLIKERSEYLVV